jgi:hypothetical protein
MHHVKKIILCLLLALPLTHTAGAQGKEWHKLLELLQKEAQYFEGKSGFIQLEKSDYNTFFIEKASASDSLIVFGMWLRDRFGNENSAQYVEEIIVLEPEPVIISAEIYYDFSFYFEDFPEAQFLRLEFDEDVHLINQVMNIYKDLKTGREDSNQMEDKTSRILLPVRAKNRAKILHAIDEYQRNSLKPQLDYEREH